MEKSVQKEQIYGPVKWTTITVPTEGCDLIYVVPQSCINNSGLAPVVDISDTNTKDLTGYDSEFEWLRKEIPTLIDDKKTSGMLILSEATSYIKQLNNLDLVLQKVVLNEETKQDALFRKFYELKNALPSDFGIDQTDPVYYDDNEPGQKFLEGDSSESNSCLEVVSGPPYQCSYCNKMFSRERQLLGHKCPNSSQDFFEYTDQIMSDEESLSENGINLDCFEDSDSDWNSASFDKEDSDIEDDIDKMSLGHRVVKRKKKLQENVTQTESRKQDTENADSVEKTVVVIDENIDLLPEHLKVFPSADIIKISSLSSYNTTNDERQKGFQFPSVFSSKKDELAFKKKMDDVNLNFLDCLFSREKNDTGYSCNFCKKVYKTETTARKHCLMHTNFKPYKCPRCNLTSGQRSYILQHMRKHTGNFLNCSECDYRTWRFQSLYKHLESHSNILLACKLCSNNFTTWKSLVVHINHMHGDQIGMDYLEFVKSKMPSNYSCVICTKTFPTVTARDNHLATGQCELLTGNESQHKKSTDNFCPYELSCGVQGEDPYIHKRVYMCCVCCDFHSSTLCLKKHLESHCQGFTEQSSGSPSNQSEVQLEITSAKSDGTSELEVFGLKDKSLKSLFAKSLRVSWHTDEDSDQRKSTSSEGTVAEPSLSTEKFDTERKVSSKVLQCLQKVYKPLNEEAFQQLIRIAGENECFYCGAHFAHVNLLRSHVSALHPRKESICDLCVCSARVKKIAEERKSVEKDTHFKVSGSKTATKIKIQEQYEWKPNEGCRRVVVDEDTDLLKEKYSAFHSHKLWSNRNVEAIDKEESMESSLLEHSKRIIPVFSSKEDDLEFRKKMKQTDLSFLDCMFSTRELTYVCNFCEKVVPELWSIQRHCLTHTDMKPYRCPICDCGYTLFTSVYNHMRKHTGNLLKCSFCDFKTSSDAILRQHEKLHLKMVYVCKICSKEFEKVIHLLSHVGQMHTDPAGKEYLSIVDSKLSGTKPFVCDVCGQTFSKRKLRNRHFRLLHCELGASKVLNCHLCPFFSLDEASLKGHLRKHLFVYVCSVCYTVHGSVSNLKLHIETHCDTRGPNTFPEDTDTCEEVPFSKFSVEHLLKESICRSWHVVKLEKLTSDNSEQIPSHESFSEVNRPVLQNISEEEVRKLQKLPSDLYSVLIEDYLPFTEEKFKKIRELMGDEECTNCGMLFHKKTELEIHIHDVHSSLPERHSVKDRLHSEVKEIKNAKVEPVKENSNLSDSSSPRVKRVTSRQKRPRDEQLVKDSEHRKKKGTLTGEEIVTASLKFGTEIEETGISFLDETFVPVFSTDEERVAFERQVADVDLSTIDNLYVKKGPKRFACNVCKKIFPKKGAITRHCLSHTDFQPFKCSWCETAFKAKAELLNHMRLHTGNQYTCPKCDFKCLTKHSMAYHYQVEHDSKFVCKLCGRQLKELRILQSHITILHNNKHGRKYLAEINLAKGKTSKKQTYDCPICSRKFSTKGSRNLHLHAHRNNTTRKLNNIKCCLCSFVSTNRNTLLAHFKNHRIIYMCNVCHAPFASGHSLKAHLQEHVAEPSGDSEDTGDKTADSSQKSTEIMFEESLKKSWYLLDSTDESQSENDALKELSMWEYRKMYRMFTFFLNIVQQSYRKLTLNIFQKIVDSSGNIECMLCGQRFFNSADLEDHVNLMHKENEFNCNICNYRAADINSLHQHVQTTHQSSRKFSCKQCDFVALSLPSYNSHLKVHERTCDIICPFCFKGFQLANQLKRHIFVNHRDADKQEVIKLVSSYSKKPNKLQFNTCDCPYCGKGFIGPKLLERHLWAHEGIKPFKCSLCDFQTRDEIQLKEHMASHSSENTFKCNQCDRCYATVRRLKRHKRNVHGEFTKNAKQPLKFCDRCSYSTSQRSFFLRHMEVHKGKMVYSCDLCDYNTKQNKSLQAHMKIHKEKVFYSCDKCEYDASQKSELILHMRIHKMKSVYYCKDCDYMTHDKTLIGKHRAMHARSVIYNCDKCGFKTHGFKNLNKHMVIHGESSLYTCIECDFNTDLRSDYREHVVSHDPETVLYWCDECDYSSKVLIRVNSHKKLHSGEENLNHVCEKCNYSTSNEYSFSRHLRTHEGNNVYACYRCVYTTSDRANLVAHVKMHRKDATNDSDILYRCSMCDFSVFNENDLNSHMKHHNEEQQHFTCKYCKYSSQSLRSLKSHCSRKHKDKLSELNEISSLEHLESNSCISMATIDQENLNIFKCLTCCVSFDKGILLKQHIEEKHDLLLNNVDFDSDKGLQIEVETEIEANEADDDSQNIVMIHLPEIDQSASFDIPEASQTIELMEVDEERANARENLAELIKQNPLHSQVSVQMVNSSEHVVAEDIAVEQDGLYGVPDAKVVVECVAYDEVNMT